MQLCESGAGVDYLPPDPDYEAFGLGRVACPGSGVASGRCFLGSIGTEKPRDPDIIVGILIGKRDSTEQF